MPLAPALAPLSTLKQFVLCRIDPAPQPGKPWKTNKVPLAPSLFNGDAHDSANWMGADEAFHKLQFLPANYGVGFVITAADPLFCVDIDDALQADGTWSPLANTLCAMFSGAAIELSDSARGLHIWGCGTAPAHGKKNVQLGIELYTEKRFILLGRQGVAQGNLAQRFDHVLPQLVSQYFPASAPVPGVIGDDTWTDTPVPEWRGPADDADLIRRACASGGGASSVGFGDSRRKATFAELYHGEVDALSQAFPSSTGKAYDESSADQALLAALAFWTGKNMERMERIARTSKLHRQKWDDRADYYLPTSIRNACRSKREVCTDALPAPAGGPMAATDSPRPVAYEGSTFLTPADQPDFFAGCVFIENENKVLTPGGKLTKPEVFNTTYGGRTFVLDAGNEKTTRKAFEAFTQSQVHACPMAYATCFRPDLPPAAIVINGERKYANTYWPIETPRKVGDATLFLTHLRKLFPNERDRTIMLSYMCAIVQHKGVKFQWAPLVQGVPGNGKSTLSRCVAEAVGKRYTHWPKANKLAAQFNSWMTDKIFYAVEDIHVAGMTSEAMFEDLKPMITGEELEIEAKGVDQVSRDICGNFIFNSNHKGGIRKTEEDRRIAVFYTPQQRKIDMLRDGMDRDYFRRLRDWLTKEDGYAIVTEYLSTWAIPDEFNPATGCQNCPDTSTTTEAIEHGRGQLEQEVLEAVARGDVGFCGGWISGHYFDRMLERFKKDGAIPPNRRREILQSLGYDWHPGLENGRVNNVVRPDGTKSKLYVKPDHPSIGLRGVDVARAYSTAQGTGLAATVGFGGTT